MVTNSSSIVLPRRDFLKVTGAGLVLMGLGPVLSACEKDAGKSAGRPTNEVIVAMTTNSEPEAGFDPHFGWGCAEHVHEPLIQSTLIRTNASLEFVGDLATEWGPSEDGLTWNFTLRDGVTFSDGTPLTAQDAAFTLKSIRDFEAAPLDLSYLDEAIATSPTTLEVHLNKPYSAFPYILSNLGIVPKTYDRETYGHAPIGSGRYLLEQWDQGQQVILTANPNYFGDKPTMQKITVLFMEEDAARAAAATGTVDIAATTATFADTVPTGYELFTCQTVDCRGISLPTQEPGGTRKDGDKDYPSGNSVTAHLEIRQAINLALDREKLVKNTLSGHGTVAYSVCDHLPWASPDMAVKTDLTKAESLMSAAGWAKNPDGVYAKGDQLAAFDLYYPSSDSVRQAMAHEFASQMTAFGIKVTPVGSSWTEDASGIYAHQFSDPILWGWGANSPSELYNLLFSTGGANYADYKNPQVDAYLDAALAANDPEEAMRSWRAAQWDGTTGIAPQGEATWVWLANIDHLYFKRPELAVAAQKSHPHGHGWSLVNNVDEWSWSQS